MEGSSSDVVSVSMDKGLQILLDKENLVGKFPICVFDFARLSSVDVRSRYMILWFEFVDDHLFRSQQGGRYISA